MDKIKRYFSFDKSLFSLESSAGKLNLFALLFPILFENIMLVLQGSVNTAVLSDYSDAAVAAVGAANNVVNVVSLVGTILSMGATVVISTSIGEGNTRRTDELAFSTLAVCTGFAVFITPILFLLSPTIMSVLNLKGEILYQADLYFKIRILFFVFTMVTSAIMALLRCYGYPKYTFWVGLLTNIINLALNVYVIYFSQYSPVTGVRGVAYSCVISNVVGFIVAIVVINRLKIKMIKPKSWRGVWKHTKSILKIGLPAGLSNMMFTVSQTVTTGFVALLGDGALSAKVYYTTILSYVYLFSSSAGSANSLMVGRCHGAGNFETPKKMNAQLVKITTLVNLGISVSVLALSRPLLSIFTDDTTVFQLAIGIFAVDIIVEQARAVSQVYEYALRAAGDIMFSTVILAIACVVFSIGLAYILAIKCGMGLIGCWIGLAADEVTRALVTYFRWRSGVWKTKKI